MRNSYQVVGIDLSPLFLKRAEQLAATLGVRRRTKFLQGDYRTLARSLDKAHMSFDAIINMWSTIGYYTDETDIEILKQCRSHSLQGSILIIETINSDFLAKHFRPLSYSEFDDILMLEDRKMNLEKARIVTKWRFYQKKRRTLTHKATVSFEFRVYTLHELITILGKAGWGFLEAYGGLEEGPLTPDAMRLLVVAKAS